MAIVPKTLNIINMTKINVSVLNELVTNSYKFFGKMHLEDSLNHPIPFSRTIYLVGNLYDYINDHMNDFLTEEKQKELVILIKELT